MLLIGMSRNGLRPIKTAYADERPTIDDGSATKVVLLHVVRLLARMAEATDAVATTPRKIGSGH